MGAARTRRASRSNVIRRFHTSFSSVQPSYAILAYHIVVSRALGGGLTRIRTVDRGEFLEE